MNDTRELDMATANEKLRGLSAEERIRWARDAFGQDAVLLSSMQKSASVLMHHFHRMGIENEILFVDTGYHFRETLQFRDAFIRRYRLNIVTLYPEQTPEQQEKLFARKQYLHADGQKECCRARKTVPYVSHMVQHRRRLTMVGVRQVEGDRRARRDFLVQDPRTQSYTLHPIYDWTDEQVEMYLQEHHVPVHPLHRQGYPSIGCECCTTPVKPDEDPRAGRWRHLRKQEKGGPRYCNILLMDGAGV